MIFFFIICDPCIERVFFDSLLKATKCHLLAAADTNPAHAHVVAAAAAAAAAHVSTAGSCVSRGSDVDVNGGGVSASGAE